MKTIAEQLIAEYFQDIQNAATLVSDAINKERPRIGDHAHTFLRREWDHIWARLPMKPQDDAPDEAQENPKMEAMKSFRKFGAYIADMIGDETVDVDRAALADLMQAVNNAMCSMHHREMDEQETHTARASEKGSSSGPVLH